MNLIGVILIELLFCSSAFALINGNPLAKTNDLVRLEFENKESVCTGFYITPFTIITAAHCLYSWKDHRLLMLEKIITSDEVELSTQEEKQIPHPLYYPGGWSKYDVAVIQTTKNLNFEGIFTLSEKQQTHITNYSSGELIYYGAGKISLDRKTFGRATGNASFVRFFSFLFSIGKPAIAPNDSGAPVLDLYTNRVIAIASKTTVGSTIDKIFLSVSISTSLLEKSNSDFIHINTK